MDTQALLSDRRQSQSNDLISDDVVDNHGHPALRTSTGRWKSALFILGVEIAERFAFYGVQANLISYLTGPLRESIANAAAAVNTWTGVAMLLPLLGAFIADSYLGRFKTIVAATLLYILSLGMLTASSALPVLSPSGCMHFGDTTACSPSVFQVTFFYSALYIMALAQGGHKPCVQAFGADQFDQNDPKEFVERSSFFNWWYFAMSSGILVAMVVLSYIQDNIGWALGFGIPCTIMVFSLVIFLLGTKTYRFYVLKDESPFMRIAKTLYSLAMQKQENISALCEDAENHQSRPIDKSEFSSTKETEFNYEANRQEEAKSMLKLFPIWASCLLNAIIFAQSSTLFTKQGKTMDRRIGLNIEVPPASLHGFVSFSAMVFVLIYDRVLVPFSKKLTKHPSGITMLQRIGAGMTFNLMSIIIAALVEIKRLKTARDFGLVDEPDAVVPMSIWWLVPQNVLVGISDAFTMVGLQEFFYDQVPDALRSLGLALYLSVFGTGYILSGFLIPFIDKITSESGYSWFSNNLNRAHIDYFYWLLSGLGSLGLLSYLHFAGKYVYNKKNATISI